MEGAVGSHVNYLRRNLLEISRTMVEDCIAGPVKDLAYPIPLRFPFFVRCAV